MKGILEFDLPKDRRAHEVAVRAMDWALLVWEVDEELRRLIKHGCPHETVEEALSGVRDYLAMAMADRGISLDTIE